jgi:predicted metalloprotease with PDZ domain
MGRLTVFALVALCATAFAHAATYEFRRDAETGKALVTISLKPGDESKRFEMPAWAPGDYQLFDFGGLLEGVQFSLKGKPVKSEFVSPNSWVIPEGADKVTALVNQSRGNFSPMFLMQDDLTYVNGSGVFGWFVGFDDEEHRLVVVQDRMEEKYLGAKKSAAWAEGEEIGWQSEYASYEELIDSPFVISSKLKVQEFRVAKVPHYVAAFGRADSVDMKAFAEVAQKSVEQGIKTFGDLPYDRYVFFGHFGGIGGGLEHRNSTRLGMWSTNPRDAAGLIFHEFAHAYNVKQIRPKGLGPFDHTRAVAIPTLWWLEGATDYLASVWQVRAGLMSKADLMREMAGTHQGVLAMPSRFQVSLEESGRRVFEARGSTGFGGVNYYTKGKMAAFLLDLSIRTGSDGTKSLDDVFRVLYDESRKDGSYRDARIRELVLEFGGETAADVYDQCVTKPVEMPIGPVLGQAGIRMVGRTFAAEPQPAPLGKKIFESYPSDFSPRSEAAPVSETAPVSE